MPRLHEVRGHRAAHVAQSDETDHRHRRVSRCFGFYGASPSPPRSRANFVCADATGGPLVRR
ncbi:hypothetical protein FZ938_12865 [Azospirillum oryzae]|nr:hypothetical protein FZ938_12865 [Azospirillum oryzae]